MSGPGASAAASLAAAILDEAVRAGAVAADVFIKESSSAEAALPDGSQTRAVERGVALRIFMPGGRSALAAATLPVTDFAGTAPSPVSEAGMDDLPARLARRAAVLADHASAGDLLPLPAAWAAEGRGLGIFDPDLDAPAASLMESAREIHALACDSGPAPAARVRLQGTASTIHLFNSAGFTGSYRQTLARLDLTLTTPRAATRVVRAARSLRGLAADSAAVEAASLLEERIEPRVPPSGIHPVVLSPRAAAELIAAMSPWLTIAPQRPDMEETRVDRGAWRWAPRRGERIASPAVTILDDGTLPGGVASAPFDGEGSRTRRTVTVERGVVRETLRDLEAGAGGGGSTGNGVRASFREAPSLRPTNFFVKPGTASPADLLSSVRQGIRISTLSRLPPLRGPESAFAVPFTGRWIEGGRLGAPLSGGYLAGHLREILAEVEAAGSDLVFYHRGGSFGSPSLLLRRAPVRSS